MKAKPINLIAAELGWGAQRHEAALGPAALQLALQCKYQSQVASIPPYSSELVLDYSQRLQAIEDFSKRLSHTVAASIEADKFPVVIGGDHAMAIGTWTGVISALQAKEAFGLIWIDAHMDSHTPQTSPSSAIHGMPLAVLLGHGEKKLVKLGGFSPKLNPHHVVLIGVRSYESGEAELLKKLNVRIYYIEEVKQRGFMTVVKEAMEYVSAHTLGFGVSVDLDAFDPQIAPGVGSPEPDGINGIQEIGETFNAIHQHPKLKALEITEYNSIRDQDNKTAELIKLILKPWQKHEKHHSTMD